MQSKSMKKLLCRWLQRGRAVQRRGMWMKKPEPEPEPKLMLDPKKLPPRKGIE